MRLLKIIPSRTGGPDLAMLPDGRLVPIARTAQEAKRHQLLYGECVYDPKEIAQQAKGEQP